MTLHEATEQLSVCHSPFSMTHPHARGCSMYSAHLQIHTKGIVASLLLQHAINSLNTSIMVR